MTRKQKHEGKQSSSRVPSDNRALVAIPTTIPVSRPADITMITSNVGRGYRAGSVRSLSSVGSVGSSNAGTRR